MGCENQKIETMYPIMPRTLSQKYEGYNLCSFSQTFDKIVLQQLFHRKHVTRCLEGNIGP